MTRFAETHTMTTSKMLCFREGGSGHKYLKT